MRRRDFDSPWKEFLTVFFRWFIQLVLPELYARINWRRRPVFLDTELRRLTPRSETGRLHTDRLVKVWEKGENPQPFLVHLEAQNQYRGDVPEQTYTYNARIWIETRLFVVSIVVLGDNDPNWRPEPYRREMPGTKLHFEYHVVKVLDLNEDQLLQAAYRRNPAALMLLAFRRAMETENDLNARFEARKQLVQLMIDRRYNWEHQAHILRLLEWVMILPEVLEKQLDEFIEEYKRERGTTFVSRFEKRAIRRGLEQGLQEGLEQGLQQGLQQGFQQGLQQGIQQGIQQGLQQGLEQGIQQGLQQGVAVFRETLMRILRRRFGDEAERVRGAVEALNSLETLERLMDAAVDVPDLQAFERTLQSYTSPA